MSIHEITKSNTNQACVIVLKHMKRMQDLMSHCATIMLERGRDHDLSRLSDLEVNNFQQYLDYQEKHGKPTYRSDEYYEQQKMRAPALKQHFEMNRHHPEHHQNGVNDMNLFDLTEMLMDWKAASERDGYEYMNMEANFERYGISPQLAQIFRNTAEMMGFKTQIDQKPDETPESP